MKYNIFGNVYDIEFGESEFSRILKEELSLYPTTNDESARATKVFINPDANMYQCAVGRNPKTDYYSDKVVGFSAGEADIFYAISDNQIFVYSRSSKSKLRSSVRKFLNIQYSNIEESAGQWFHEILLIDHLFFRENHYVLHGSAIADANGNVTLVGGTGGTGKTSTLIALSREESLHFVCDDLCICTAEGAVYPNFAYPKIYAYNTIGNPALEEDILHGRTFVDKLQWRLKKAKNPAAVRRRIRPDTLYQLPDKNLMEKLHLNKYIFLNRCNCETVSVSSLSKETAVDASIHIINSELSSFISHLHYFSLNASYNHQKFDYTPESVFQKWAVWMDSAFSNVEVVKVDIPFDYDNQKLKEYMRNLLI